MKKIKVILLASILIIGAIYLTFFITKGEEKSGSQDLFDIPIIDMQADDAGEQFYNSLTKTGFACFKNHGIDIDGLQEDWEKFFDSSAANKMQYLHDTKAGLLNGLGYYPYAAEKAEGAAQQNKMEYYHVATDSIVPKEISKKTKRHLLLMYQKFKQCIDMIDAARERRGLKLPERIRAQGYSKFSEMLSSNLSRNIIRAINYPASSKNIGEVVNQEHTDISALSLLFATQPGLRVRGKDGKLYPVGGDRRYLIVNAGDPLMWGTDGHLEKNQKDGIKSTLHQVIRDNGLRRLCFAAFFGIKDDVQVKPDRTMIQAFNERIGINLENEDKPKQ